MAEDQTGKEDTAPVQLKLRFQEWMRAALEGAAKESASSLNGEIVARLRRSLEGDQQSGGPQTAHLLRTFAAEIERAERHTEKNWWQDTATHTAAMMLIADAMRRARPKPQNFEEANALNLELNAKTQRRDVLHSILKECHAIHTHATLAQLYRNEPHAAWYEAPETAWTKPDGSALEGEDDRAVIREIIAEHRQLDKECLELLERVQALVQPHMQAREQGAAIHRTLTETFAQD